MDGLGLSLADQVALVTGGSRGIGRAISQLMALAGAHVVINYQSSQAAAQELAREIMDRGGSCELKQFDVADPEKVLAACQELQQKHGGLDVLVNNAGITRDQLFVRMKPEEWRQVMQVNLDGAFNCSRAVARSMMKRRRGCIVNMASVAGLAGNPGQANYSASKAGLIGLTKALAKELAPWSIRVNAVCPGFISTEMTGKLSDKVKEDVLGSIPLARFGSPEDVAWAVLFLASPAAQYITGEVINVSGGLYI